MESPNSNNNHNKEIIIALISASVGIFATIMANYEKLFPRDGDKSEIVEISPNIEKIADSLKIYYIDSLENVWIKFHRDMLNYSDVSLLYKNFRYAYSLDQRKERYFDFFVFTSARDGLEEFFDTNLPKGTYSIAVDSFEGDVELLVDFINYDTIFSSIMVNNKKLSIIQVDESIESIRVKLKPAYEDQTKFYSLLIFSDLE